MDHTAEENRLFVVKHSALKGYQAFSIVVPLAVIGNGIIRRQPLVASRFLRNTYVGGGAGAVLGGGAAWGRLRGVDDAGLLDRRVRLEYNISQRQVDDYSMIGNVIGAVGTAFVFWNRAPILNCLLGGAGLGSAGGVFTHLIQQKVNRVDVAPTQMRDV